MASDSEDSLKQRSAGSISAPATVVSTRFSSRARQRAGATAGMSPPKFVKGLRAVLCRTETGLKVNPIFRFCQKDSRH